MTAISPHPTPIPLSQMSLYVVGAGLIGVALGYGLSHWCHQAPQTPLPLPDPSIATETSPGRLAEPITQETIGDVLACLAALKSQILDKDFVAAQRQFHTFQQLKDREGVNKNLQAMITITSHGLEDIYFQNDNRFRRINMESSILLIDRMNKDVSRYW